jgi:hypothetical protein
VEQHGCERQSSGPGSAPGLPTMRRRSPV